MKDPRAALALAITAVLALPTAAAAEDFTADSYTVSVQEDVTYGQGAVGASGPNPHLRDLNMDVYRPLADGKPLTDRPAIVLAFGGAFYAYVQAAEVGPSVSTAGRPSASATVSATRRWILNPGGIARRRGNLQTGSLFI